MLTIRFDEEDHHRSAPYFNLPGLDGNQVSLRDFHEVSNLVLVFLPEDCPACDHFLRQLASRSPEFNRENARLLAVFPQVSPSLLALNQSLDGQILQLEDRGQAVRRAYTSLMAPGLVAENDLLCFVLDNYGAPYACLAGSHPGPADQEEILSWLRFIGIQCPE